MNDEHALAALRRAIEEHARLAPHAPMKLGPVGPDPLGGVLLSLLVLRPCRCGAHRAAASFRAATLAFAAHEARVFVEALTPPEPE